MVVKNFLWRAVLLVLFLRSDIFCSLFSLYRTNGILLTDLGDIYYGHTWQILEQCCVDICLILSEVYVSVDDRSVGLIFWPFVMFFIQHVLVGAWKVPVCEERYVSVEGMQSFTKDGVVSSGIEYRL